MRSVSRRRFLALAAAIGATPTWALAPRVSRLNSHEARELFPEGVASGDPDSHSVLLWTRRPHASGTEATLQVEVSEDEAFTRVVAQTPARALAVSDWTCRVLVGNLKPARVYWYRFIDGNSNASRIGRTITAPGENDPRPVKFAFVSCHDATTGAANAFRRMIFEDERAPGAERLEFVLHLGDFYYEGVRYPEDRPQGVYGRPLRDVLRYPHGEKIDDYHFPSTVKDFRAAYRAYLHDPDLQDARARWPFVCIWDNGEFSWEGWQSNQILTAKDGPRPSQTRKVAANRAWFEYQPAHVRKSSGPSLDRFNPPSVRDAPIHVFDECGMGQESNNLAALDSLTGYRALRWGKNVDLIITDQRSYCSEPALSRPEAQAFRSADFPRMFPQEVMEILDAGRTFNGGRPPATIRFDGQEIPNFRKDLPAQTILGARQKAWFLERLRTSQATWKIWGNSLGTLDGRVDSQNLPPESIRLWPGSGYALNQTGDFATAYTERAEIYAAVRDARITGFATVSGNTHSFWAGLAAPYLPPQPFEPIGVAFVTGSISAIGFVEAMEHNLSPSHPLRRFYVADGSGQGAAEPPVNLLLRHGVRSVLKYLQGGDPAKAREGSNRDLNPHLSFVDLAGHGYSVMRVTSSSLECEFVCIPRPIERSMQPDGGPLLYRVLHRTRLWKAGEGPQLEQIVVAGDPFLSL